MSTLYSSLIYNICIICMREIVTHANTNGIGITLPGDIIEKIDELRGDVARSRYILRLIESSLERKEVK